MKINRNFTTKAKTHGSTTRVIASTGNPDRYQDIVVWNDSAELAAYMANPVVQFGHNYDTPPIGKTVNLEIDSRTGDLVAEIQWDDVPDNPLAQTVARQFREGYMSAVSVGFQPGESVPRNRLPKDHDAYGERGSLMTSPRLLEISAVPVPANAEALAIRGVRADDSQIVDMYDDADTYTIVFRKMSAMDDDEEEMGAGEDEEEMGMGDDDEDKLHDPEHPGPDEEDGYHDDEEDGYHDDEEEEKSQHDEDEDAPSSVRLDAPSGYHWMDYQGGPVLMRGDAADHDGAMASFPFEVVSEHDPDRMKQALKSMVIDLLANDPAVRMMLRSVPTTRKATRPTDGLSSLFGIDKI